MSAFLVTHDRVAHRMVELEHERHPERLQAAIDGMIREFRLHADAPVEDMAVYVPADLPDEVAEAWVRNYAARLGRASGRP
jgi:hypothetical protein